MELKNVSKKYQILCVMLENVAGSDGIWQANLFHLKNNLLKYNSFFQSDTNLRNFMAGLEFHQDSGEPLSPWRVTSKVVPSRGRACTAKRIFTFRKPLADGRVSHL